MFCCCSLHLFSYRFSSLCVCISLFNFFVEKPPICCFWKMFLNMVHISPTKMTQMAYVLFVNRFFFVFYVWEALPSVLWRCWLGGRKGTWPVKTEWWGAGMVICLEWGADLHMAQLMPLPLTVSCFSKIQIDLTFLVPAHLGSPWQRTVKRVCVCCVWEALYLLCFFL